MGQIEIPILNSEYLYEQNPEVIAKYNTRAFGSVLWQSSLRQYQKYNKFSQDYAQYFQKKLALQPISIQIAVPEMFTSINIQLLGCDGIMHTLTETTTTWTQNGDLDQFGSQQIRVQFDIHTLAGYIGKYCWYVEYEKDAVTTILIGEPMDIQFSHPEHLLIEYSHDSNDFDIIWDRNPIFYFLLPANIEFDRNEYKRITFRNQSANLRQVYVNNWRLFNFEVGFPVGGVNSYDIDKLQNIFKCDNTAIDGVKYLLSEDSEFTKEDYGSRYPLSTVKVQIVEYNQSNTRAINLGGDVFLFSSGSISGYPYVVDSLILTGFGSPGVSVADMLSVATNNMEEILDGTQEIGFLGNLNSLAASYGMLGSFLIEANNFIYRRTSQETYTLSSVNVLSRFVMFNILVSSLGTNSFDGVMGQDNPNTSIYSLNRVGGGVKIFANYLPHSGTTATINFDLAFDYDSYELRVYYNGEQTYGNFAGASGNIVDITGQFPNLFQGLTLSEGTMPLFNPSYLTSAETSITDLTINNFGITTISAASFDYLFFGLINVSLALNNLDASNQDLFYDYYNTYVAPYGVVNGYLDTTLQTPTSSPTGASASARLFLTSMRGFIISY